MRGERPRYDGDREFAGSLFHEINQPHSTVNLLIGSKKFTEGWSSWRVSTMGLMNVGKGEGAQIIQLFGRGVRLKGYDMSLKRSGKATLPEGHRRDRSTSAIAGDAWHLRHPRRLHGAVPRLPGEEGLPTNDDRIEFVLPVIKNLRAAAQDDPAQEDDQRRQHRVRRRVPQARADPDRETPIRPEATLPAEEPGRAQLVPENPGDEVWRLGRRRWGRRAQPDASHARHVAFLDLDRLYFELERFKAERGWYNLNLTRDGIRELLLDPSWYRLLIPDEELAFDSFEKVRLWEEIAPLCSRSTPSATTPSASANGSCRTSSIVSWKLTTRIFSLCRTALVTATEAASTHRRGARRQARRTEDSDRGGWS